MKIAEGRSFAPYGFAIATLLIPWAPSQAQETLFDISVGPRSDEFNWSIAAPR